MDTNLPGSWAWSVSSWVRKPNVWVAHDENCRKEKAAWRTCDHMAFWELSKNSLSGIGWGRYSTCCLKICKFRRKVSFLWEATKDRSGAVEIKAIYCFNNKPAYLLFNLLCNHSFNWRWQKFSRNMSFKLKKMVVFLKIFTSLPSWKWNNSNLPAVIERIWISCQKQYSFPLVTQCEKYSLRVVLTLEALLRFQSLPRLISLNWDYKTMQTGKA